MQPSVLIVLPCYNPNQGWEKIVHEKFTHLQNEIPELQFRLTIVNDGSKQDLTQEITYLKQTIRNLEWIDNFPNRGKGAALRTGFNNNSSQDYYLYTDIDFPYTIESMKSIILGLQNGLDIAVGVRDDKYYEATPMTRKIISKFLRWLIQFLLKIKITDTQCGLKGFNHKGKQIFLQTTINRFLFDLEFIFIASKQESINMKAIPVELTAGITFSKTRISILLNESLNFLKILVRQIFA
ncbi:MAG: glycosyltransferase family 2 protein [Bacteroidia bacterium]|nr:glycosyltransferase family 2 protein [Bacteroidia bacterium]